MSGITSGVGLVSGINTQQIISQLLSIEARPRTQAQRRLVQLQTLQTTYLDLNSRLNALKTAASRFATANIFSSAQALSSNENVLTASASAGAALGEFTFVVDRLVSTQQVLSRGFADRAQTAVGAGSIILEPVEGRLDRDTSLADLHGGSGVQRGRIVVTDSAGGSATIDLTRAATVSDVLDAINGATGVGVNASVRDGAFIIEDTAGGAGTLTVTNGAGSTTADSLGIRKSATGTTLTGDDVYGLGDSTSIASLNDGAGVRLNRAGGTSTADFTVRTRDGSTYSIDVGTIYAADGTVTASPAANVGQLRERIEDQTEGKVTLVVASDGFSFELVDSSTPTGSDDLTVTDLSGAAADLGLTGTTTTATLGGRRVLAGLNTTLSRFIGGGAGVTGTGEVNITARDGSVFNITLDPDSSVDSMLRQVRAAVGSDLTVSLNASGTGLNVTDNTGGGSNLIITGDGATALGIATDPAGIASNGLSGSRVQRQFITESTRLATLNAGRGVGTGTFRITDSTGNTATIDVGADDTTLADVIEEINASGVAVTARINDNGDGLIIEDNPVGGGGALAVSIEDTGGAVARGLNIAKAAADPNTANFIDGSFERTIEIDAADTLDDVVLAINDASAGVRAAVINDGSSSSPFRLSITSTQTGAAGRFTIDTGGLDLSLTTMTRGENARVFYGSSDPAAGVLLTSTTNSLDGVVSGLRIDLVGRSDDPVNISVSRDTSAIETALNDFITAFNNITSRIASQSAFNQDTNTRGVLLGDSTAQTLRNSMFSTIQGPALGVSGQYRFLSQIGITVGSGGTVGLDTETLREALEEDPDAVRDLVAAKVLAPQEDEVEVSPGITVSGGPTTPTYTSLGVAERLARLVERYTDPVTGILTGRNTALNTQITLQNSRISAFDVRLASRRQILERQFAAMERSLAQLQSQSGSLSSIQNLFANR